MASFSSDFPVAFHVLPLQAWPSIAKANALLAKPASSISRPTTSAVDSALGFEAFVHLYLAGDSSRIVDLPILKAQLTPARESAFPHAVLELHTWCLDDAHCTICNWNLAVSRPRVTGVKGGNWTRGTNPNRIREVWDAFRASQPSTDLARGLFYSDSAVPVLRGRDIASHLRLLRSAPRHTPELMIRERIPLTSFTRLITFSENDAALARSASRHTIEIAVVSFPGYTENSVSPALTEKLRNFFSGQAYDIASWKFDEIRRRNLTKG